MFSSMGALSSRFGDPGTPSKTRNCWIWKKSWKMSNFFNFIFFPPNHKICSTRGLNRMNYGQNKVNDPKKSWFYKNHIVAYYYVYINLIEFGYLSKRYPVKKLHRFAQSEIWMILKLNLWAFEKNPTQPLQIPSTW